MSGKASLVDVPAAGAGRKVVMVTVGAIVNSREAIMRLSQQPVPVGTAQKYLKLKSITDELGSAFGEKRDALASEKGTPNGPGKWKLEADKMTEFNDGINDLLKEEVQFPQEACISLSDLGEAQISAADLELISYAVIDLE